MKNMNIRLLSCGALLLSLLSVSCKTAQPQAPFSYEESSHSYTPTTTTKGIVMNPLIADLQVIGTERISYRETFEVALDQSSVGRIEGYKNLALSHAEKEYKADVILDAKFDVRADDKEVEIIVSGYPAVYKNFRNATKKDKWMIRLYRSLNNVQDLSDETIKITQ